MAGSFSDKLTGLQAMRAIAALLVVVHHAMEDARGHSTGWPEMPAWLTTAGAAGVDVFFVISGFIMMVVSFPRDRAPEPPLLFLRKRVARIYPLYWACLAFAIALWAVSYLNGASEQLYANHLVRWLFLAPSDYLMIVVSWTLIHEMNFYLLFALMLGFRNRMVTLVGVTCLLLAQLALAPYIPDPATAAFLSHPIALEFAFGLALGYAYLRGWLDWRMPVLVTAAAFACIMIAPVFIDYESTKGLDRDDRVWAWGIPAVILVAASLQWRIGDTVWGRTWTLLGDASYAIYLVHPFVLTAIYANAMESWDVLKTAPQIPVLVVSVALSTAIGVLAHIGLERPLTRLARRVLRLESTRPATVTVATAPAPRTP